jgi:hypothetical protein
VLVFDKTLKRIEQIHVPEGWIGNLSFSDKDRKESHRKQRCQGMDSVLKGEISPDSPIAFEEVILGLPVKRPQFPRMGFGGVRIQIYNICCGWKLPAKTCDANIRALIRSRKGANPF